MGPPNGSLPDLDGTKYRACMVEENTRNVHTNRTVVMFLAKCPSSKIVPDALLDGGHLFCKITKC